MTDCEKVNLVLKLFAQNGEYNFSQENLENDLRVTIRISADFNDSLMRWGQSLPDEDFYVPYDADYVVGTIRSGMKCFLNLRKLYRCLNRSDNVRVFPWKLSTDYSVMREAYLRFFPELTAGDLKVTERLDCLMTLCEIQLVFLASNFRRRILSQRSRGPLDTELVMRQLDEAMKSVEESMRLQRKTRAEC
jgi:hypothetical protein